MPYNVPLGIAGSKQLVSQARFADVEQLFMRPAGHTSHRSGQYTLCLDLQGSQAGHPHSLPGRGHTEHDSLELLGCLLRCTEVQFHQIFGHCKSRQTACTPVDSGGLWLYFSRVVSH